MVINLGPIPPAPKLTAEGAATAFLRNGLTRIAKQEWKSLMQDIPQEIIDTATQLAGGTKTTFPIKTGAGIRSLQAAPKAQQVSDGFIADAVAGLPYVRVLERGGYKSRGMKVVEPGRYLRRAFFRWRKAQLDNKAKEAMQRAFERAAKKRDKLGITI